MSVSFDAFFEALWGHVPYPWQRDLAARVREDGWPDVLDLPTGSGKTAVVDIALHHFVADRGRSAPRRILLVVDRRVIVDQVGQRARAILSALRDAAMLPPERRDPLVRFRDELASIVGPAGPLLHTDILRGGTLRSDAWAAYPHTPVLAGSTVDQVGSRLFFRGYGTGDGMRSVHAGLVGCDTLLLLDEVHLARPFADVLAQLVGVRRRHGGRDLGRPFRVVQLSATPGVWRGAAPAAGVNGADGDTRPHRVLRITEADRQTERLGWILGASKPARLETVAVRGRDEAKRRQTLADAAVRHALAMVRAGGRAIAIVVNRVDTARRAWAALRAAPGAPDAVLITGRMRPFDQAEVIGQVQGRIAAGRSMDAVEPPLLVVATQCIEAGADYDFDGLVTELASLDALRQRFGRLDRRGEYALRAAGADLESAGDGAGPATTGVQAPAATARAVILARSDQLGAARPDPVYGTAMAETWRWLESIARDGTVDFGIDALGQHLAELGDGIERMLVEPRPAPVLLPAYLDQWVQTRPRPHADPEVSLFLHGIPTDARSALADVRVVWRADIEEAELAGADGGRAAALAARVAAVPPSSLEALPLPVATVRRWLARGPEPADDDDFADVEGASPEPERVIGDGRRALVWRGTRDSNVVDAGGVEPGVTLVVPASYGGIGEHGTFDPAARPPADGTPDGPGPLYDLGDAVQLLQRGSPVLRLDTRVIGPLVGVAFATMLPDADDEEADPRAALLAALDAVRAGATDAPPWFRQILDSLQRPRFEQRPDGGWIAIGRSSRGSERGATLDLVAAGDEEDPSFTGSPRPELLDVHLDHVAALAGEFARRAGLPPDVVASIRWAARLHDIGKADPTFQVWLQGGDEIAARFGDRLAKSVLPWQSRAAVQAARARAGYPEGQRHELVGLHMIQASDVLLSRIAADGADPELVMHLVASHHGWCRPLAPLVHLAPDAAESVTFEVDGLPLSGSTDHGFARLGSGVVDRFWRLVRAYGWHELAFIEAVLRLADHRASAGDPAPDGAAATTAAAEGA